MKNSLVILFALYVLVNAQYYGYNCGRGVGKPGSPILDKFDECCYWHDRCYEGYDIGIERGFFKTLVPFGSEDRTCDLWVAKCMVMAKFMTGRNIPDAIKQGVLRENSLGLVADLLRK